MKILVTESQYKKILREEDELLLKRQQLEKVIHIPSLKFFNDDWNLLQKFLKSKGNPPYTIGGDLDLRRTPIKSLGNLTSVGGYLDLRNTPIESLGKLTSVGDDLYLEDTTLSINYTKKQIRKMVDVSGKIYL